MESATVRSLANSKNTTTGRTRRRRKKEINDAFPISQPTRTVIIDIIVGIKLLCIMLSFTRKIPKTQFQV